MQTNKQEIESIANGGGKQDVMIGAMRRKKICALVEQWGVVNVTDLAQKLGVALSTVRKDLQRLEREGKLIRSHGGAISKDTPIIRPTYKETMHTHLEEKEWIGEAAVQFLPQSGTVFIAPGTTTLELARRIPEGWPIQVVTNCTRIAPQLASGRHSNIQLLGGPMRPDAYETDCLSDAALEVMYWDVAFIGTPAVSVERGLSTFDMQGTLIGRKIIEHTRKLVVLADSSKFNLSSYVVLGPVNLIDVLITDIAAPDEVVDNFRAQGIEVIVAGPNGQTK